MDGRYKASGSQVLRKPIKTDTGITMGFVICEVSEYFDEPEEVAKEIAEAMNLHMDTYPDKH